MTLNLRGEIYGRLTVLEPTAKRAGNSLVWKCKCRCGNQAAEISARDLRSGVRRGCGACADSIHPLYSIWRGMISRCENSTSPGYKDYGGRGITICERWRKDFLNFVEDVGERPANFYSIDRKDVNGNYEPGNVRWATPDEQANNKRDIWKGLTEEAILEIYAANILEISIKNLSEKFSVTEKTIYNIRTRNYSIKATDICIKYMLNKLKSPKG